MDESIINTLVGDYRIDERIKAGGMAVVYKATDERTGETIALKLLQTSWAEHEEVIDRFEREARIMKGLNHPHIVQFRDYGTYQHRPYIVMDYLAGGSLSEKLRGSAHITLQGTARLLGQIASALDYAHGKGIVHRDLKPGNILLDGNTHAAITDFGIARVLEHTMITTLGQMPGTPQYMSPEQARGDLELMQSSDIYSLGVIAYLLSTGTLPFTGTDPMIIMNLHLTKLPPVPSSIKPELNRPVDRVLQRVLEKKAENRYSSVVEFALAFEAAIRGIEDVEVHIRTRRREDDEEMEESLPTEPIFSPLAPQVEFEPTFSPVPRRGELIANLPRPARSTTGLAIALVIALAVIVGLGVVVLNGGGDDNPDEAATQAALAIDATEEVTPEITEEVPTATGTATQVEAAVTLDASVTPSTTPSDTATRTATATGTRTPTTTASLTLTPSSTSTPTRRPSPTPPLRLIEIAMMMLEDVGTPGAFNCEAYNEGYEAIQDGVARGAPDFMRARQLLNDPDNVLNTIYNQCGTLPEGETITTLAGSQYSDLRNVLERFEAN